MRKRPQHGFTIIELSIATVVFSIILLICLKALIQLGRIYIKGVTIAQTQDTVRKITNEVMQDIQLSAGTILAPAGPVGPQIDDTKTTAQASGYVCIGNIRYSYIIDRQLKDTPSGVPADKQSWHALWADIVDNCANQPGIGPVNLNATDPEAGTVVMGTLGRELLIPNMRLTQFSVKQLLPTDTRLWQVVIDVVYGDTDLLLPDPADSSRLSCQGPQTGTQFCATSEASQIVNRRLK